MQACMAAGDQVEQHLVRGREMGLRYAGKALPIAVTAYTVHIMTEKPRCSARTSCGS